MSVRYFKAQLTTTGYVHIGTGKTFDKKDYFVDKGQVALLDQVKFIANIPPEQIDNYCSWLCESNRNSDLDDFLGKNNLMSVARRSCAYRIDVDNPRNLKKHGVFEFVKDGNGTPYIPGSTFKGMLRTILLCSIIENNPQSFKKLIPHGSHWHRDGNASKNIENDAFTEPKDAENSEVASNIMRYISVSDSAPLGVEDLVFVQKFDQFAKSDTASHKSHAKNHHPTAQDGNRLNIYRECLKPGTRATLHVSIDEKIDELLPFPLDAKHLETIFEQFSKRYEECFVSNFHPSGQSQSNSSGLEHHNDGQCLYVYESGLFEGRRCPNQAKANGYCKAHAKEALNSAAQPAVQTLTCYLGGGVDFNSKTILNALYENNAERLEKTAHILYDQFPTQITARGTSEPRGIKQEIASRNFPTPIVKHKKNDHRHWQDIELGVSPHTRKLGKNGNETLPMGACEVRFVAEHVV